MKKQILAAVLAGMLAFSGAAVPAGAAQVKSEAVFDGPAVNLLLNRPDGVKIGWTRYPNAVYYRVFTNENGKWKTLGDSSCLSYIHKTAQNGRSYTYTVRAMDKDKRFISGYNNQGYQNSYRCEPQITKLDNTATGTKIYFTSSNTAKYRVFAYDNGWHKIGETADTVFTHNKLTDGKTYTYTVRCVDNSGKFTSEYNKDGWKNTFIAPPTLSSASNAADGVSLRWSAKPKAGGYRVYRKSDGGSWGRIGDSANTSLTDKTAVSGTKYTYTVRGIDGSRFTTYFSNYQSVSYVAAPAVTGFENANGSTKLKWNTVKGAAKYRVFYRDGSSWKKLGDSASAEFTDKSVKNGQAKTYTVRCLNSSGGFVSGYNGSGWTNTYYAPPAITSAANNTVRWNAVGGAAKYRVYRSPFGGKWETLGDTAATSFTDTTAKSGVPYRYTLRLLNESGKGISGYLGDNPYYCNGALANGKITVNGTSYNFSNGRLCQGLVTVGGAKYYYDENGVLQKNGIVGNSRDGYYYADKNGKIDTNYRGAVTSGGSDWIVKNGKATKATSASDKTLFRAMKLAAKITDSSMTMEQKLRKCFDHIKDSYPEYNPRIPHYTGTDWPVIYANDIFLDGGGNCLSCAAAFGYLAKAIGYENVYACHSGGHGWAEVNGLVYDPEWARHRHQYSYYGMSYNTKTDVDYKGGISAGKPFMHVKL